MQTTVSPQAKFLTPAIEELKASVESKLQQRFADGLISTTVDYDFPVFVVKREILSDVVEYLYNDTDLAFQFLTTLATTHSPEKTGEELCVMYQLHNLLKNTRIRIKTHLPISDPKVRTVTTIFATANWMERQEYDFFGVIFDGHPNLKRILNMDEMNYHPMLKQYRVEDSTREDKDNSFFGR